MPSPPTAGAARALAHAKLMLAQTDPAIWFDSWNNDGRDNDMDGRIDDPREQAFARNDGRHYARPHKARVGPVDRMGTGMFPEWALTTINVTYKVCIDIPIESYKAARVPISSARWIPTFFKELKHIGAWRVWDGGGPPDFLVDGDVIAANNTEHQHAGIVETGMIYDSIINLPGPTSRQHFLAFYPSGRNDMTSVPRTLFEKYAGIDLYARWIAT